MAAVDAVARMQEISQTVAALQGRQAAASDGTAFAQALLAALGANGATAANAASGASLDRSGSLAQGVTGEDLVAEAKTWVGVPYVLGGNDRSGVDCSGLVQQVLAKFGIDAERRVSLQTDLGVEVPSMAQAQPGDLIITNNADHVVIYAGDGMIVHAPYEGRTVSYQKNYLDESDVLTIRRLVPDAGQPAAAAPAAAGAGALGGADVAAQLQALLASSGGGLNGLGSAGMLSALLGLGGAGSAGGLGSGLGTLGSGLGTAAPGAGGLGDLVAAAQLQAILRSAA
ncbi:C40 family peptidase [Agromyces soli]|uniref:C40 family peptidase n=1 Tax=Agromyces soli TaxID=659012 RepID=UPI002436F858|nr:C40 family peptidase [Agromyces soli]